MPDVGRGSTARVRIRGASCRNSATGPRVDAGFSSAIGESVQQRLDALLGDAEIFSELIVDEFVAGVQGAWLIATASGAGLAWLLGMMPSTIISLLAADATQVSAPPEPGPLLTYTLAAALGVVAGPILGFAQWTVLRKHAASASRWLWANALAWAVGMPLIFAGMDLMPWSRSWIPVTLLTYGLFAVVGAVVGAIHGRILVGLR